MTADRIWHYNRGMLVEALRKVGIQPGDVVFSHLGLGMLGYAEEGATTKAACKVLYDAFLEVLGDTGTWLVPTYSYSYCKNEVYDPLTTPSAVGPFTEYFRKLQGVVRSLDPIFSVAGLGPLAAEILHDLPHDCFGKDCVYAWLRRINAKICNVGVGFRYSTFVHYVEDQLHVPYRYHKLFSGHTLRNGALEHQMWLYNVRVLGLREDGHTDLRRLEGQAYELGLCQTASVGRGQVTSITCQDMWSLCAENIQKDPWCLVAGPEMDLIELENQRVGKRSFNVHLPREASMMEMVDLLWHLPRDIISDGYDAALEALAKQIPMTVHEYPTGTHCWTWIIPEKWTCHEAYLETLDSERLFSYADSPLHVVSYSLPYEGEVSREELLNHLYVHPKIPEAIPFKFKYYERDWGLCCSENLKDSLTDDRYRVVIKTNFSYSTLKVGEVVAPSEREECIVLCAHLCHPAMVNDDLTGVVVGLDVMRELLKRRTLRYTYRFLIVPETIGSVAYLSHNEELIPRMKGGLFLEMLGLENPHALQLSFDGNTELDQCFALAMKEHDPYGWTGAFRTIIGNDERQFNAPGVRVPMLSLSRVLPPSALDWPYREYHSSHDTLELVSIRRLEESRNLVLQMIDTLENNLIPVNKFKGEVFCSRYGLHIDFYTNPEGHRALFDIMYLVDGTRSVAEIASACGISFRAAKKTIDELHRHGLVEYTR